MVHPTARVLRQFRFLSMLVWFLVGLPVALQPGTNVARITTWGAAFVLSGAAIWWGMSPRTTLRGRVVALTLQVAAVLALVLSLCFGLEGTLLAVVAFQLAMTFRPPTAHGWILVQSALFAAAVAFHWAAKPAFLLTPPYLGLQLLTFWCARALFFEANLRRQLEGTVLELEATRELLADSARSAERLDIRDTLHDVIGHRLVALRLNLASLARDVKDPELELARSLLRQIHDDVEGIVRRLQDAQGVDLERVLGSLARVIPRPLIHVNIDDFRPVEPQVAQLLFHCCLEVVTNVVKHAGAKNLWIVLQQDEGLLRLGARDDGFGAKVQSMQQGHGLDSMRRRLSEAGGDLEIHTGPGQGFRVEATLPVEWEAA